MLFILVCEWYDLLIHGLFGEMFMLVRLVMNYFVLNLVWCFVDFYELIIICVVRKGCFIFHLCECFIKMVVVTIDSMVV